jgi:hypothetical protein
MAFDAARSLRLSGVDRMEDSDEIKQLLREIRDLLKAKYAATSFLTLVPLLSCGVGRDIPCEASA